MTIEPTLYLDGQYCDIIMNNGYIESDNTLLNAVQISLFTENSNNKHHNLLLRNKNEKIGSKFMDACKLPVNIPGILDRKTAAKSDLSWLVSDGIIKDVVIKITAVSSTNILLNISLMQLNKTVIDFSFEGTGQEYRLKR